MQEGDYLEALYTTNLGSLTKGEIYRLDDVLPLPPLRFCLRCEQTDVQLLISKNGRRVSSKSRTPEKGLPGWCPCFFRPIYRRREDLLQMLCEPVDGVREAETT